LARLDQQGLVVAQLAQRFHDRVERLPGARRSSAAPIDDELVGILGDLRVEVVHQHAQGRLLLPALAGDLGATRGVDFARPAHRSSPIAPSTARSRSPVPINRSIASSSGLTWRSGPGPGTPAERIAARAAAVPGPGSSGARSSSPRAAQAASTARMRLMFSSPPRSFLAAPQPIETWSSCIALVGSESTPAGPASRRFSATIAAWVYWASIIPECTPASSARNGGRPNERLESSSRSVRRSA